MTTGTSGLSAIIQGQAAVARAVSQGTRIRRGVVVGTDPLRIRLDGDSPSSDIISPWVLGSQCLVSGQRVLSVWWDGSRAVIGELMDTGWQPVALTGGWRAGAVPPIIRRMGTDVHVQGTLITPSGGTPQISVLAQDFWPTRSQFVNFRASSGPGGTFSIDADGGFGVYAQGSGGVPANSTITLSGRYIIV